MKALKRVILLFAMPVEIVIASIYAGHSSAIVHMSLIIEGIL